MSSLAIGVDVGGTGIKAAALTTRTGELLSSRHRVATPAGATPADVLTAVTQLVTDIRAELALADYSAAEALAAPVGVALPAVVRGGITRSAANISPEWIGFDAATALSHRVGAPVTVLNDADAAGVAEALLGAAAPAATETVGTVLVLTFGTGIGSALLHDGHLFPNTELGHLDLVGYPDIERFASGKAVKRDNLSYPEWAERLTLFLRKLEVLFSPDLFVLGGGISKDAAEYLHLIEVNTPVRPARFRNRAGIVGAALACRS